MLVLDRETKFHGVENHLSPVRTAVDLLVALGCHLNLMTSLATHGDASSDSVDDVFILELHQLEQLLTTLECHPVNHKWSRREIAEQPPLVLYLVNGDTLGYRVSFNAVVFGIIVPYEIYYTEETHLFIYLCLSFSIAFWARGIYR